MSRKVISDTHFWHTNIIKYCDRPFSDADEMDTAMIDNWNSVVNHGDDVFHLGDFAYGPGSKDRIADYVSQLNGNIILIKGNHDRQTRSWYLKAGFAEVIGGEYFLLEPFVLLSHRPYPTRKPMINIFGHIHNLMHIGEEGVYKCVSVEQINYTPVDLDKLIRSLR